jgi:hypothetical protein
MAGHPQQARGVAAPLPKASTWPFENDRVTLVPWGIKIWG